MARTVDGNAGLIVDQLMKDSGVGITEMSNRMGVSRQAMNTNLRSNMGFDKFIKCLEVLGYGITIRPADIGNGLVDISSESICTNCAYRRMGEALQDIQFMEKGAMSLKQVLNTGNQETQIE